MASVAPTTTASRTLAWQQWVPCIGMALCSWLSFVDRQVLAVLQPTIAHDTGLTPGDFASASSFFFLAYTVANPVWGSVLDFIGLRVGMLLAEPDAVGEEGGRRPLGGDGGVVGEDGDSLLRECFQEAPDELIDQGALAAAAVSGDGHDLRGAVLATGKPVL